MANTILTTVTTSQGIEIPSGVFVRNYAKEVDTYVIEQTKHIDLELKFYASEQAFLRGCEAIQPVYSFENMARIPLTYGLTVENIMEALSQSDVKITEYLKSIYGEDGVI